MFVAWNKEAEGFQSCWLWQFGKGPFEVLRVYKAPEEPNYLGPIEISFEPGCWLLISIPEAAYQYRVEYGIKSVLFHQKWLIVVSSKC